MTEKSQKKRCMTCIKLSFPQEKKLNESELSDLGGTVFSSVNPRPNSKFHNVIVTKRHTEDLRTLTEQEWADMLPVLKDSINKIENYYKYRGKPGPLGYRVAIPCGDKASQNEPFHFYCRIVPKYKKWQGTVVVPDIYKKQPLDSDRNKNNSELDSILQPALDKIAKEKDKKIFGKLQDGRDLPSFALESLTRVVSIFTKNHLPSDIQAIDPETWQEIGQMLKELMAKIEANTDCHDFHIDFILGEEARKVFQEEWQDDKQPSSYIMPSELVVRLLPRYKRTQFWCGENRPIRNSERIGGFENKKWAFKLNDPVAYTQEWGKKSTPSIRGHEEETNSQTKTNSQNQEIKDKKSIWKQPYFYWGLGGGAVITALLGLGLFLFYKKNNKK